MPSEATESLVPCACGCGQLLVSRYLNKKMTRFVHGHNKQSTINKQFWGNMDCSGECWIWQGYRNRKGYGHIRITVAPKTTRLVLAHRLAYELTYGQIPEGKCVCHHCDNPSCCRPDHLFIGTIADNQHDMKEKGRSPSGESHYLTKLREADVIEMRSAYSSGLATQAELARRFNVTRSTVGAIITRRTWKHVA